MIDFLFVVEASSLSLTKEFQHDANTDNYRYWGEKLEGLCNIYMNIFI